MGKNQLDHEDARSIRRHWFRYLDTIEPVRAELFSYCHRLTRNIWDAEDLVQDTLLVGYGMTARGDFHGESSPVRNMKAYLFRTASNAWLDQYRKYGRQMTMPELPEQATEDSDPVALSNAVEKVLKGTSPHELVAILLKDVYDFSLEEIADFIGTTTGTVKSALSRARQKMQDDHGVGAIDSTQKVLVQKFVAAINSQEVAQVVDLMATEIQIKVCNVGGGRGRNGIWTAKSIRSVRAEYAECDNMAVVLLFRSGEEESVSDILRLEGSEDSAVRLIDYCYAPETLKYVAETLGYKTQIDVYHQPWEVIDSDMVPTTFLPWRD